MNLAGPLLKEKFHINLNINRKFNLTLNCGHNGFDSKRGYTIFIITQSCMALLNSGIKVVKYYPTGILPSSEFKNDWGIWVGA